MDQNPTLQNLVFNIIYEMTSPNKSDKLEVHQMIGILSLTNLLGIMNYMSLYAPGNEGFAAPLANLGSGNGAGDGGGELLQSLLGMLNSKRGGNAGSGLGELNPQNLMMLLNMLSSLGQKRKPEEESNNMIRETGV
jgi:hypothetical protein